MQTRGGIQKTSLTSRNAESANYLPSSPMVSRCAICRDSRCALSMYFSMQFEWPSANNVAVLPRKLPSPPGSPRPSIYLPPTSLHCLAPADARFLLVIPPSLPLQLCRTPDHAQCSSGTATARVLSLAAGQSVLCTICQAHTRPVDSNVLPLNGCDLR
jgi:hypothetical protein